MSRQLRILILISVILATTVVGFHHHTISGNVCLTLTDAIYHLAEHHDHGNDPCCSHRSDCTDHDGCSLSVLFAKFSGQHRCNIPSVKPITIDHSATGYLPACEAVKLPFGHIEHFLHPENPPLIWFDFLLPRRAPPSFIGL